MKFKESNLRKIAECVIGDNNAFEYRSSSEITEFFCDCGFDFIHDGSTRWWWTKEKLEEILDLPSSNASFPPKEFINLLNVLMHKSDAKEDDINREKALIELNKPLSKEGFEAFYAEDNFLYLRNIKTKAVSVIENIHRPLTPLENEKRNKLKNYLDECSEDDLIEFVILPIFKHLGFQRITIAGHKDKSLEYGKDVWMKFMLPTFHVLYFGIQAKKGKLDASGMSKSSNLNVAEIYNQICMMLGHEIFDPEINKRVLIDHAFIIAGGEITKQARNWLGSKLDANKRSQVMFMDREDILNIFIVNGLKLPNE